MFTLLLIALALPIHAATGDNSDLPTDLTGFPPCAQTCISDNHGSCALLDVACMCNSQVPTVFSCMQGSCSAEDQATTLKFAQELCDQLNATSTATLSVPLATGPTTLATSIPSSTSSSSPSSIPSSHSSGLSTAAMAGVGVGAVLGAIAVAGVGFIFWRRRRAGGKKDVATSIVLEPKGDYASPPAYGPNGMVHHVQHVHHEAYGVQRMELEAREAPQYIR